MGYYKCLLNHLHHTVLMQFLRKKDLIEILIHLLNHSIQLEMNHFNVVLIVNNCTKNQTIEIHLQHVSIIQETFMKRIYQNNVFLLVGIVVKLYQKIVEAVKY